MKPDMRVQFAGIELTSPVIAASGTFGYGIEFEEIVNLEQTPADIKVDEVKSLPRASPSWKRLRLADLGYLVESKVLDRRERETPDQIRKGLKRGG